MTDTIPCPIPGCGSDAWHLGGGVLRCLETGILMTPTHIEQALEAWAIADAIKNRPAGTTVDHVLREVT
jgi:hypothetical protein